MARLPAETPFAIFTAFSAFTHFSGETYYHVVIGQPLSAYVVDLIAIALMFLGAGSSLLRRDISSAGWLAGGWGFAFCLNYRSFFGRLRSLNADNEPGEPSIVLNILGVTLVIAVISFAISMYLARPRRN